MLAAVGILVRQGTIAHGKDEDVSKKMFTLNPEPLLRERREGNPYREREGKGREGKRRERVKYRYFLH